ncbi:hypothetical protein [Deefgea sp. CFH1-16]|uniref:hypothetical protein n=1 Tax=Deefgea sp. CFH1-16 TaxID=2675457 RepID=UPI0015F5401E|nr:hypothetical protein [Deefgea sp. CFH1-16]MBM5575838.1 hypothetical protein [Deefgea sp. CFH1-16]
MAVVRGVGDSSGMGGGGHSNGGDGRGGSEARGYGSDGEAGAGRGNSQNQSDEAAGRETGSVSQAISNYIGKSTENRNQFQSSIISANRELGIGDASTAAELATSGYQYGDLAGFNQLGPYDALGSKISPRVLGLVEGAASAFSPVLGVVSRAVDLSQKVASNGVSSLTVGDGLSMAGSLAPLSSIKNAGLMVKWAFAANDVANGDTASAAGRVAGLIGGQMFGRAAAQLGGELGGKTGAQIGGFLGGNFGSIAGRASAASKGGAKTSPASNAQNNQAVGGKVTLAVNQARAPSVAQERAGYEQPAMKYLNTSEYMA